MSTKKKTKQNLDDKLSKMEQLIKIINIDSCLLIYSYLMVFGKTTPAKLREVTGLSKATMFRNLALFSDVGILKKRDVKGVSDRRYSLHYFISKNLVEHTKKLLSNPLRKYAESIGRTDLVRSWLSTMEVLPLLLNQYTSQAITLMAQKPTSDSDETCPVVSKMIISRLGDMSKIASLNRRILKLVEEFDSKQAPGKRDYKEPLIHPVALSINVVALNPRDIPKD
ncbi:MAG: hypothetical protein ACTSV2_01410 [Candidatus Thorarchaeota archaeon]